MKEFVSAYDDLAEDEDGKVQMLDENDEPMFDDEGNPLMDDPHARFKIDGRMLRAYQPTEGQIVFMMAGTGRGQTREGRFSTMINIMLESLRDEDKDYLESRMLTRDVKQRLRMPQIEGIFESLIEEWFARPTQSASGSVVSSQTDTQKSTQPTTTPEEVSSESAPTDS